MKQQRNWTRPVNRMEAVIGGLMIFCLLFLTTLSIVGVIGEDWMPKLLFGWATASVALYLAGKVGVWIIKCRRHRRSAEFRRSRL